MSFALVIGVTIALVSVRLIRKSEQDRSANTLVFVLATCYLAPIYILYAGDSHKHVDIAAASIAVTSITVAVAVATVINLTNRLHWPGFWLAAPISIWLLLGMWLFWENSAELDAGLVHLATGIFAWLVGAACAFVFQTDTAVRERAAMYLTGLLSIQAAAVFGQIIGLDINPMSAEQRSLLEGRYNGLLNHPGQLANATLLIFVLILALRDPATSWRSGRTTAIFTLVIGICIAAGSRAQILGALLVLGGWAFFAYGQKVALGKRIGAVGIAILGLLASYPVLRQRFEEDPTGGGRAVLQEVGLQAAQDHPWVGVGPNSYVSVIGLSDALTATGVPVHNAFLLSAVELGIIGAALLWLPVTWTFVLGFRRRKDSGILHAPSAAAAALFAPFVISTFTGWGLLADPLFPLLMATMGALYALMTPRAPKQQDLIPVLHRRGRGR